MPYYLLLRHEPTKKSDTNEFLECSVVGVVVCFVDVFVGSIHLDRNHLGALLPGFNSPDDQSIAIFGYWQVPIERGMNVYSIVYLV